MEEIKELAGLMEKIAQADSAIARAEEMEAMMVFQSIIKEEDLVLGTDDDLNNVAVLAFQVFKKGYLAGKLSMAIGPGPVDTFV